MTATRKLTLLLNTLTQLSPGPLLTEKIVPPNGPQCLVSGEWWSVRRAAQRRAGRWSIQNPTISLDGDVAATIGGTGAPGGGFLISEATDSPLAAFSIKAATARG